MIAAFFLPIGGGKEERGERKIVMLVGISPPFQKPSHQKSLSHSYQKQRHHPTAQRVTTEPFKGLAVLEWYEST